MQKCVKPGVSQSRVTARPVSARQGYSKSGPYNAAFKAANSAMQKAQSRDLAFQSLAEIESIIGDSMDSCDALSGLVAALTAHTMNAGSRIERKTVAQSLCAVAARLGKRAGFTWPRVLQYLNRQMRNSEVFETDRPYMAELAAVYGAYTQYVLEPADMAHLVSCVEEAIEREASPAKTAGIMALSRIVEEMHARGTFSPMEHGVRLAEYLCGTITRLKKDPDDQPALEAMLLLQAIVQMSSEIMGVPPLARKIVSVIADGCTHRSWRVREAALQVIGTTDIPNRLSAALVKDVMRVAETCKYDRINAVRLSARSLLIVLDAQGQSMPKTPRKRPQSSAGTHTWSVKSRPQSVSLEHRYLDRPPNRNTLIPWVFNARHQLQPQPEAEQVAAAREPIRTRAYTFVPTNSSAVAPPFRQSQILDYSSSSTSSITDCQLGSEDLLRVIEEASPKVQTAIFCRTPVPNVESSASFSSPIY